MTIEELLTRYGQNCHRGAPTANLELGQRRGTRVPGPQWEAGPRTHLGNFCRGKWPHSQGSHRPFLNSECGTGAGQGGEPGTPTGEAGPSCSSAS